jgi:ABC-type branched-subunit amino acid transport system substrate-binding protein
VASKTSRLLASTSCLALALGVAACGGGNGGGEQQLDLVIGDSIPLTGDLSYLGPAAQKSSDLAVDQINSAIAEAGVDHSVRVVHEDNQTDTDESVKVAGKMVHVNHASCLTGAWASDDTLSTAQAVAIPGKVLEISPASMADEITTLDDQGLVNRVVPTDTAESMALADAISEDLDGAEDKTVNVGARSDSYGDELSQRFIEAWQGAGGTVGGQVIYSAEPILEGTSSSTESSSSFEVPSTSSSTFFPAAQQITDGDPDAIVIADYPPTFASVASALEQTGSWDPETTWGTDQLASVEVPNQAGADLVEGMRTIAPGTPRGEDASKAFNALFKTYDPKDVTQAGFDAQQFDATILCYLAAVAAGSTDGQPMADKLVDITAPGGDEFTWQQLPDAIKALQDGDDIDYVGASGPIDMDANGDAAGGVFDIYQFQSGELKKVGEVPVPAPKGSPDTDTDTGG